MALLTEALADAMQAASATYTGGGSTGLPSGTSTYGLTPQAGFSSPTPVRAPVLDPAPLATPGVTVTGITSPTALPAAPAPTPCGICSHTGQPTGGASTPGLGGGYILPPGGAVTLAAPSAPELAPGTMQPLTPMTPAGSGFLAWLMAPEQSTARFLLVLLAILALEHKR